ncbi:DUF2067 family protein [Methanotorris igneus]|uniref:DUF2067 domain-containing protein n=1 Tax=Methanotorris igneus (strain DSM 5666 / JCM 11834 / Kol 5) TaxID=880724 RepID=F6BDC1_METIK|nr:DUF2067 domain-containing protein [Methanotorris igneus]AEF96482.1 Protein of unknown function DUF2067 [Methanotorris igneus Kol 5]
MRKVITAKTSCSEEMLEICDRISKLNIDCLIESRENLLRIKIFGYDKDSIVENYRTIVSIIERVHRKYTKDEEGMYEYSLSDLKYPVNKDLIIDTLKALGHNVKYLKEEGVIKTSLELDKLNEILCELNEIYGELAFRNIGSKPVKNVIVLAAYLTGKDVDEVIEEGLEKEFFREENGRIVLNKDIKLAKKELAGIEVEKQ